MNRSLLAAVLAATALSSSIAWAEQKDSRGEGGQQEQPRQQQRQGNQPARQAQQQPQRQAQTQRQAQPQGQHQPQGQSQAQAQRQPQAQGQGQHQARQQAQQGYPAQVRAQSQAQPRQQAQAQVQRQGGPAPRGGGFSYGGRQHAQIQAPGYSYPQGYSYRRWGVGQDLPMLFLNSQYFFNSYGDYGIGAPPYGSHWVRYGPDLLLVSDRTGRIRQVIYGAFY